MWFVGSRATPPPKVFKSNVLVCISGQTIEAKKQIHFVPSNKESDTGCRHRRFSRPMETIFFADV